MFLCPLKWHLNIPKVKIRRFTSAALGLSFYGTGFLNCFVQEKKKNKLMWLDFFLFFFNIRFDFLMHLNLLSLLRVTSTLNQYNQYKRNQRLAVGLLWNEQTVLPASTWALEMKLQPPMLLELPINLAEFGAHKTLKTVSLPSSVCSHVTLVTYSRKAPVPRGPRCSEQIMRRAKDARALAN